MPLQPHGELLAHPGNTPSPFGKSEGESAIVKQQIIQSHLKPQRRAQPWLITQSICKLPTSAAIELSGRAAGLLARIEACTTPYFEGGTNGAKALGLSGNKRQLKKYRDELVQKGFVQVSGKNESRCYRLELKPKAFKQQQTIPSAIVNDLQVGANPRLILLAVLMSKKVRGGELRTSWKRLGNELGICRNSVPDLMETLSNRYEWVAFEKEGSWWHVKPGKGMRPTSSETATEGLLRNDHDVAAFDPRPCCISSPYTHPLYPSSISPSSIETESGLSDEGLAHGTLTSKKIGSLGASPSETKADERESPCGQSRFHQEFEKYRNSPANKELEEQRVLKENLNSLMSQRRQKDYQEKLNDEARLLSDRIWCSIPKDLMHWDMPDYVRESKRAFKPLISAVSNQLIRGVCQSQIVLRVSFFLWANCFLHYIPDRQLHKSQGLIANIVDRDVEDLFNSERPYGNGGVSHADRIYFCHPEIEDLDDLLHQAKDDDGNINPQEFNHYIGLVFDPFSYQDKGSDHVARQWLIEASEYRSMDRYA